MFPSVITNLFWGASKDEEDGVPIKHTTSEEAGEWLLISSCPDSSGIIMHNFQLASHNNYYYMLITCASLVIL